MARVLQGMTDQCNGDASVASSVQGILSPLGLYHRILP